MEILLKAVPYEKESVTFSLECGVDGLLVDKENLEKARGLARIKVYTEDDFEVVELKERKDEEKAKEAVKKGKKVLIKKGWEVIALENLVAWGDGVGVEVEDLERAKLAAGILEKGVDFLVVLPEAVKDLKGIVQELRSNQRTLTLTLTPATIIEVKNLGLGHRVCVDTCSILKRGQGLLVGNSSSFMFLVHAETEENPYARPRPFRVNAGAVHQYVLLPGDRTSYLEELRAGDEVLVVDHEGKGLRVTVGRVKVEVRPLLLVRAKVEGKMGEVILQNAETIRLVGEDGNPVSVVSLEEGSKVLVRLDEPGRHFGVRVKETIEER